MHRKTCMYTVGHDELRIFCFGALLQQYNVITALPRKRTCCMGCDSNKF